MSAHDFYVIKGIIGLLATVLFLVHMNRIWHTLTGWARPLRYLALLAAGMLLTYASVDQIRAHESVDLRARLAMTFAILLLGAAIASLTEDRQDERDTPVGLPPA